MTTTRSIRRLGVALAVPLALATAVAGLQAQARQRQLYVSVVDKKGVPIAEVTPADVVVREDGAAREILSVTPAKEPMRIALLVDNSQAATRSIQFLREALNGFAARMTAAGHSIAFVTLGDRPTLQVDATTDLARLKSRGIDRLFAQPGAGMYLLEALLDVCKGFTKNETPRPVIVSVTTEGTEFSNSSGEHVVKTIKETGALYHAIVLTEGPRADLNAEETRQRAIVLDRGTKENGGERQIVISEMALKDELDALASELLAQVAVTYATPDRMIPPEKISIEAKRPELTARGVPVRAEKAPVSER